MRFVKVPMERTGVLIGPDGETKDRIERTLGVHLLIDSTTGDVEVDDRESKDPMAQLKAENVVRAIGRGFAPERAFKLFGDDAYLSVVDMHDFVGKSNEHVRRMTARLAGSSGRTRQHIEELTGAHLSIHGHTVSVLGDLEAHDIAREAVLMILQGSEHASVYRFLEGKRRAARAAEFGL